jgi:hypothetical protein
MHPLDRIPAVRRIETDRPDVFAIEITGFVTGADVENLYGLLEGAYALHDRLDVLVRLNDYQGSAWDEISASTAKEGRQHALQHVQRCAAVGDPDWTDRAAGFFEKLPVELKHFPADDEAEAWTWIGAREIRQRV